MNQNLHPTSLSKGADLQTGGHCRSYCRGNFLQLVAHLLLKYFQTRAQRGSSETRAQRGSKRELHHIRHHPGPSSHDLAQLAQTLRRASEGLRRCSAQGKRHFAPGGRQDACALGVLELDPVADASECWDVVYSWSEERARRRPFRRTRRPATPSARASV